MTGPGTWEIPLGATHLWSNGTLTGTGATNIKGELSITGGNPTLNDRNLTNQGILYFAPANYLTLTGNVTITNAPSSFFNLAADTTFNRGAGTHVFDNQAGATLVKSAGTGVSDFNLPVTNAGNIIVNSGTLRFSSTFTHTGGTIVVDQGATAQFTAGLNLTSGVLAGGGTVLGNVTVGGLVVPGSSPGQLSISGNLTLLNTSATIFELGGTAPVTGHDFISVTGTATLAGQLLVSFVGGFQSTVLPSDTFTLLAASSRLGTFVNAPTSGLRIFTTDGLGSFQLDYTATGLTLSNFAAVPEPSTWALMLVGTLVVALQLRRRIRR
jgi:hypothetical protein